LNFQQIVVSSIVLNVPLSSLIALVSIVTAYKQK